MALFNFAIRLTDDRRSLWARYDWQPHEPGSRHGDWIRATEPRRFKNYADALEALATPEEQAIEAGSTPTHQELA